jgi:hypothetical protein
MRRAPCLVWLGGLLAVAAGLAYHSPADGPRHDPPPPPRPADAARNTLPLAQVVLFNNGVGYFQREGTVEGDARVELAFPAENVNDLLKSLVLQDDEMGSARAVSYDSHEPVERTLNSYALDLTGNPAFGQLLNQARGEKVEVSLQDGAVSSTVGGKILGMESQTDATGKETHLLNLLASDGLRSLPLNRVQRVRFLNPALDAELDGALRVLEAAHDSKKKAVRLQFKGTGKRTVRVGYVVESPVWKTTYRLVFDKDGKPMLQGWAVIENTTDEDWKDVRLALVSGRPLSFSMDLYEPLFVPRPKVEPELFASLRPPAYNGALLSGNQLGVQLGALGALGALGVGGVGLGGLPGTFPGAANLGGGSFAGGQYGQVGYLGAFNRYQPGGFQGGPPRTPNAVDEEGNAVPPAHRLTYEELQKRRQEQKQARQQARQVGSALAAVDPKVTLAEDAAENAATEFEHLLDQKLSLARQKSALVQILDKEVQGKRVSIFNESVHARAPLLGLKFKNTTGKPLTQGPLLVYEAGRYAGDARILDLQPGEERLLAFALDQGVEVKTFDRLSSGPRVTIRTLQGELNVQYTQRRTHTYLMRNRSQTDRLMMIEHPVAPAGWALAADNKPAERTRDLYRFEIAVPAGKATKFDVAEEQSRTDTAVQADKVLTEEDRVIRHYASGLPGIELDRVGRLEPAELVGVQIAKGVLTASYRQADNLTYRLRNVSKVEREVTLEHQCPDGSTLAGDDKPIPGSVKRYLFAFKVAPGKVVEKSLREVGPTSRTAKLAELDEEQARWLLDGAVAGATAKAVLRETLKQRHELEKTRKSAEDARAALRAIVEEQARLRANLERLPTASAAYKRYLEKFDTQETQIEKLQAQIAEAETTSKRQQKDFTDFVTRATAE